MERIGNNIYIQKGENLALDLEVSAKSGTPLMLLKQMRNPYLVMSVASTLYTQQGAIRENHWLDLSELYVEQEDGTKSLTHIKKFMMTDALPLRQDFYVADVLEYYDFIVLDPESDFDIMNYLFVVTNIDGTKTYKYVKEYTKKDGGVDKEVWEEYSFRVIKQFITADWVSQDYKMDIKLITGESLQEHIVKVLADEGNVDMSLLVDPSWTSNMQLYIDLIEDKTERDLVQQVFDSNMPLMPEYDLKVVLQDDINIFVNADKGGY